jgi:hypothetical protein
VCLPSVLLAMASNSHADFPLEQTTWLLLIGAGGVSLARSDAPGGVGVTDAVMTTRSRRDTCDVTTRSLLCDCHDVVRKGRSIGIVRTLRRRRRRG